MKKSLFSAAISILGLVILFSTLLPNKKTLVSLGSDALLIKFSLDDMIKEADLIVIGEVKTTLPSRWNGPNGNDPKNASPEEISRARGLFTDSLISINQILKGDVKQAVVRVRSFTGETENVRWVNDSEPSYVVEKTYLLFLAKDSGATAKIDAGDYVSVGAYQGVFEIVNDKAISRDEEWFIEDLIAYIENSLSGEVPSPPLVPTEVLIETPLSLTASPAPTDLVLQTPLPTETPLLPVETSALTETPTPVP